MKRELLAARGIIFIVSKMNSKMENLKFHADSLMLHFPDWECRISGDLLTWIGKLRPTPMSRTYEIKIEYEVFKEPRVRIMSLGLIIPNIRSEIHMYNDGSLCLYYNEKRKEWHHKMALAISIVPWTCEWLYFYEIWLVTRKWFGKEISL